MHTNLDTQSTFLFVSLFEDPKYKTCWFVHTGFLKEIWQHTMATNQEQDPYSFLLCKVYTFINIFRGNMLNFYQYKKNLSKFYPLDL